MKKQTIAGTTFYTVQGAADELKVSKNTVHAYIKSGKIQASRLGHRILITEEELIKSIEPIKPI